MILSQAADLGVDESANLELAQSQIDYALGSTGRSFVVGFGVNPPQRPHHRSSSCKNWPATCGWDDANASGPNPQVLYGALVGGPEAANDVFVDDRTNYITNEVATDYNAAYQATLAGLKSRLCQNHDYKKKRRIRKYETNKSMPYQQICLLSMCFLVIKRSKPFQSMYGQFILAKLFDVSNESLCMTAQF